MQISAHKVVFTSLFHQDLMDSRSQGGSPGLRLAVCLGLEHSGHQDSQWEFAVFHV